MTSRRNWSAVRLEQFELKFNKFCTVKEKNMKSIYTKTLCLLLLNLFMSSSLLAQGAQSIAVAAKVRGKTEHKVSGGDYAPNLRRGKQINNKDWVRTKDDGYIALMFIDDKTLLKIRENSELEIKAIRSGAGLEKSIQMSFGKVKAVISPQITGEFTISTPTSVASVKGTTLWIISTPEGDQIIVTDGTVTVTNNESGETVTVTAGQTATSNPDGTIGVQSTPAGGVPDDPDDDEGNQLRIKLENPDGDTKEFIIDY